MTWFAYLEPIAAAALRNVALITISTLLILVLLPAALGAAGPQGSIGT